MAKDITFFSAFIDGGYGHRILGIKLRPFCLWHLMLLQAINSPFIREGDVYVNDLRNALAICRLRFGNSRLRRSWWPPYITHPMLEYGVKRFLQYTGDFLQLPEYAVEENSSSSSDRRTPPPEPLMVACDVMREVGCDECRAWEMPLGMARWYSIMYARDQGARIDFINDDLRAEQQALKEAGIIPFNPTEKRKRK